MDPYEKILQSPQGTSPFSYVKVAPPGLIMEFGVAGGGTLGSLAGAAGDRKVYGFDSFFGLPEDCGGADAKGSFNRNGAPPPVASNVELVIGLFQDTLVNFLAIHPEPISFVHIDVDLYSSATFVLEHIEKRLQKGTILAFDELVDWHADLPATHVGHWRNCEYKAFNEMVERTGVTWECLSRNEPNQVAIRIT